MTLLMITNGVFNECALGFIAFGERVTAQQTLPEVKKCVYLYCM